MGGHEGGSEEVEPEMEFQTSAGALWAWEQQGGRAGNRPHPAPGPRGQHMGCQEATQTPHFQLGVGPRQAGRTPCSVLSREPGAGEGEAGWRGGGWLPSTGEPAGRGGPSISAPCHPSQNCHPGMCCRPALPLPEAPAAPAPRSAPLVHPSIPVIPIPAVPEPWGPPFLAWSLGDTVVCS